MGSSASFSEAAGHIDADSYMLLHRAWACIIGVVEVIYGLGLYLT
jgi:hypothetical protein